MGSDESSEMEKHSIPKIEIDKPKEKLKKIDSDDEYKKEANVKKEDIANSKQKYTRRPDDTKIKDVEKFQDSNKVEVGEKRVQPKKEEQRNLEDLRRCKIEKEQQIWEEKYGKQMKSLHKEVIKESPNTINAKVTPSKNAVN